MRKLILIIAVLIAAVIGISLSTLSGRLARIDGADVSLVSGQKARLEAGDQAVVLVPSPAVDLRGLRLRAPESDRPLATSALVRVHPRWLPLLVGRARIGTIDVETPTVVVERRSSGMVIGIPAAGVPESARVRLSEGRIEIVDSLREPPARTTLGPLDALVRFEDAGGIFFELSGSLLGAHSKADARGAIRPDSGPTGGTGVEFDGSLKRGDPRVLARIIPLLDGLLDGDLDVEVHGSGFIGERSTENVPATPLEMRLRGSVGLTVLGHSAPLTFDATVAADDRRYQIRKAAGQWGGIPLEAAGWRATDSIGKLSARASVRDLDLAATLAELGIPERWRAKANVTGNVRVTGTGEETFLRYEARAPRVTWRPLPDLVVEAEQVSVNGSLLAVNADVSASFEVRKLRVGNAWFDKTRFGGKYWRGKLQASTVGMPLWGGEVTLSGVYYPKEDRRMEGGGIVSDIDASAVMHNLFPRSALEIDGRLDAIFEAGRDPRRSWTSGRVGLHRGRIGPVGMGHAVLAAVARYARHTRLLDAALVATYADALSEARVAFDRLAFDFQSREDGMVVRGLVMESRDLSLRAEGLFDADGRFAGWGAMTFSVPLTTALVQRLPDLAPLAGEDGRLRLPVKLRTDRKEGLRVEPGDAFLAALDRVARGERVGSFVPLVPEGSLEMEMPSLEEQFGR